MLIGDLVKLLDFEAVKSKILLHYGAKELYDYEKLFFLLKEKSELHQEKADLTDFINAFIETEDDSISVTEFDENDPTLHFDVCGFINGEDILYSIASADYDEFLRYRIDSKTIKMFSPESILAHCLYEITAYGFEK